MISALGLDLSLTAPGLVLLCRDKGTKGLRTAIAEQIPVPGPKELDRFGRIDLIGSHVAEVVQMHKPRMIVIEGYGQVSHGGVQSFVKVVEVGTLVRLLLWAQGLKWTEVPPSSLKKFVTGKGAKVDKKAMIAGVAENWGFETKNHNVADAYGLAALGMAMLGATSTNESQRDVLDRIKHGA